MYSFPSLFHLFDPFRDDFYSNSSYRGPSFHHACFPLGSGVRFACQLVPCRSQRLMAFHHAWRTGCQCCHGLALSLLISPDEMVCLRCTSPWTTIPLLVELLWIAWEDCGEMFLLIADKLTMQHLRSSSHPWTLLLTSTGCLQKLPAVPSLHEAAPHGVSHLTDPWSQSNGCSEKVAPNLMVYHHFPN